MSNRWDINVTTCADCPLHTAGRCEAPRFMPYLDETRVGQPVDLLVGYAGRTTLLEVKKPLGPRGGSQSARATSRGGDGTCTRAQLEWRAAWKGEPAITVRTPAEALAAIGATP